MKDELISSVASILNEWNPLGDKASEMNDLEGYKYEAMDILSTIKIKRVSAEVAISQVLTQAFGISLDPAQLSVNSARVEQLLNVQ